MQELLLTKTPQSPATSQCVIIQMCVCVCVFVPETVFFPLWCHYRFSRSQDSPCLPSMVSELSPRESCIRRHHGNRQTH